MKLEIGGIYRAHSIQKGSFWEMERLSRGVDRLTRAVVWEKGTFVITPTNADEVESLDEALHNQHPLFMNEFKLAIFESSEKPLVYQRWQVESGVVNLELMETGYFQDNELRKQFSFEEYLMMNRKFVKLGSQHWIEQGVALERLDIE